MYIPILLRDKYSSNEQNNNFIIVNVSLVWLQELLDFSDYKDSSIIMLTDLNGLIIGHPDETMYLKKISGETFFSDIKNSDKDQGILVQKLMGEKTLISFVKIKSMPWLFLKFTSYSDLTQRFMSVQILVFVIAFFFIIISILASVIMTKIIYAPIQKLVFQIQNFTNSSVIENNRDDLQFISRSFESVVQTVNQLNTFKSESRVKLNKEYLRSVLTGAQNSENTNLNLQIDIKSPLTLIIFKLDKYINTELGSLKKIVSHINIQNTIRTKFCHDHTCEVLEYTSIDIVVLLNSSSNNLIEYQSSLENNIKRIQIYFQEKFSIILSAYLYINDKEDLSIDKQFIKLLDISRYRLLYGLGCILNYHSVFDLHDKKIKFPIEIENAIIYSLKQNDISSCEVGFKQFITEISISHFDFIQLSLTRLTSSIFDLLNSIELQSNITFNKTFIRFIKNIDSCQIVQEIIVHFKTLFSDIIKTREDYNGNKVNNNVITIQELIHDNFQNINLSVKYISDVMGMSSVYLGKIFKDQLKISISAYITNYRLKQAETILITTKKSVKEIAAEIGMPNPEYFFRKFKEKYNITPSQYKMKKLSV
jgi:AraC-like DNA-binding protein